MSEYRLAGHSLETPLVNAAGSINGTNEEEILKQVTTLAQTPIGAITVGSFTIEARPGNEATYGNPVYWFDAETGTTYNSMGLPNIGLKAARRLLPQVISIAHQYDKPVIASVSPVEPNPEIGDTFKQIQELVYYMQLVEADMIEINTSCPNIVTAGSGRKPIVGYDLEAMGRVNAVLSRWSDSPNAFGLKLPPYITTEEQQIARAVAHIVREDGTFKFVSTCNTIPGQVPRTPSGEPVLSVPGGAGGMSGPSTRETGRQQLELWRSLLPRHIDVISTLGVDGGHELAVRRRLGAAAAGSVTMLWESRDWGQTVSDVLIDWVEAEDEMARQEDV